MNETFLTQAVIAYKRQDLDSEKLFKLIATHVYSHHRDYGFRDSEEASETLSDYYERLPALIERYSPERRSFEAYLSTSLRFHKKSMYFEERNHCLRLRGLGGVINQDLEARESAPEEYCAAGKSWEDKLAKLPFSAHPPTGREAVKSLAVCKNRSASVESAAKRILFLTLKCAYRINDGQVLAIAQILDIPQAHLESRLAFLRYLGQDRLARIDELRMKRDKVFSQINFFEHVITRPLSPAQKERYEGKLERLRVRLHRLCRALTSANLSPTSAEIALALGVPKGTVDSGLHYFRRSQSVLPRKKSG
jgi:DNA-directed RNA polymerase specialized sigma24 family protein